MALAPEEVGQRIRQRRIELGWTHRRLADEMGTGERTVQRWQVGRDPKSGKSWLPRLGTLMDLADRMGVERSYFVEEAKPVDEVSLMAERVGELGVRIGAMEDQLAQLVGLREQIAEVRQVLDELLRARLEGPARAG